MISGNTEGIRMSIIQELEDLIDYKIPRGADT